MIQVTNPADCCGCTACASICAHDAISMEPDALGFLYPKVDESKCVECGLCEKVCQFNDSYDCSPNLSEPIAYAARHKDINEVMKSRSGAAFVSISDYILEQGGVVYGVGYKDHFRVAHKRAITKEECDEFGGSKYVQSDLTGVFRQVKEDLKNGFMVLFSGTPCQTAGLNAYIGKKLRGNLVLVDIVCHGVPSPFFWRDYVSYLEKKQGDKIVEVNFRDKELFGWRAHRESYVFKMGGKEITSLFTSLFYKHIMFRHSCEVCHYTNLQRPSDITLADFWGWENNVPGMNDDDKGLSLMLLNTEKGKEIFDAINHCLDMREVSLENSLQPNLQYPSTTHPLRLKFEDDYKKYGFKYVLRQYGNVGWKFSCKRIVSRAKHIIKKIKKLMYKDRDNCSNFIIDSL